VEIPRLVRHPKYGKILRRKTVCHVHDETDQAKVGDTVEIVESRPLSRTKRWSLARIVTKAPSRTLSNLEGAVAGGEEQRQPANENK
jgi:small subunit ribosomal protein S17